MSARVLKWPLRAPGTTRTALPAGFVFLSLAFQGEELFMWIAQDNRSGRANRELVVTVVHTGEFVPEGMEYLASAHLPSHRVSSVVHAFHRVEVLP